MNTDNQSSNLPCRPHAIIEWTAPRVHIPLLQHQGKAAKVVVNKDDLVHFGQPLTHSDNLLEVPVHASISGIVETITQQHITLRKIPVDDDQADIISGNVLQSQHKDITTLFNDWTQDRYIRQIHDAGLVGLGGSCYPVAAKISKLNGVPADTLLINAAECDPSISCDEALIDQSAEEIATGICLAQRATNPKKTIIGVESDKREQGQKLLHQVIEHCLQLYARDTELHVTPPRYPSGAESLLMSSYLGRSVTSDDIHNSQLISFNVGTCHAIAQALVLQTPCTHRIATVVDSKLNSVNLRLPLGTPISDLASQFNESPQCTFVMGGEMMGRQVGAEAVVTKASNCIQFKPRQYQQEAVACVRCSLCTDACPVDLLPQFLLAEATANRYKNLQTLKLQNCIECGCCDQVCPSHIPLASIFSTAKKDTIRDEWSRHQAELAKARFEKRRARLKNREKRQFKKLDKKQTTLSQQEKSGQDVRRKMVEEALQRAKSKKQHQSKNQTAEGKDNPS